jgi:hypothetical protein
VLIIPSSWGSQRAVTYKPSSSFSGAVAGEKEDFCKGSLARTIFYFIFSFSLLYFCLHRFIKNTKTLLQKPLLVIGSFCSSVTGKLPVTGMLSLVISY